METSPHCRSFWLILQEAYREVHWWSKIWEIKQAFGVPSKTATTLRIMGNDSPPKQLLGLGSAGVSAWEERRASLSMKDMGKGIRASLGGAQTSLIADHLLSLLLSNSLGLLRQLIGDRLSEEQWLSSAPQWLTAYLGLCCSFSEGLLLPLMVLLSMGQVPGYRF